MGALSITAGDVKWVSGVSPRVVRGGETGTRGQAVYRDSADNEHKLADADDTASDAAAGILLSDAVDGADCLLAVPGSTINVGATTVAGVPYCVASTDAGTANGAAGGIHPYADLGSGDFPCILFWGSGSGNVTLVCEAAGVALA